MKFEEIIKVIENEANTKDYFKRLLNSFKMMEKSKEKNEWEDFKKNMEKQTFHSKEDVISYF